MMTFDAFLRANLGYIASLSKMTYEEMVKEMVRSINLEAHLRGIDALFSIAESANPPAHAPDACGDVELPAKDGWKVMFHYDCHGDLRYISHFVTPSGQEIDFWEWNDAVPGRDRLIAWCGAGDAGAALKSRGIAGE